MKRAMGLAKRTRRRRYGVGREATRSCDWRSWALWEEAEGLEGCWGNMGAMRMVYGSVSVTMTSVPRWWISVIQSLFIIYGPTIISYSSSSAPAVTHRAPLSAMTFITAIAANPSRFFCGNNNENIQTVKCICIIINFLSILPPLISVTVGNQDITMAVSKKSRKSEPSAASTAADGLVLDQSEIMRAMLAAQKGKQKEESEGSDQSNEDDDDASDEGEDEEESSGSEAESSVAAQRNLKRQRSLSLDLDVEGEEDNENEEPESRSEPSSGPRVLSRTALATKDIAAKPQSKPQPNGFASAPKPSADVTFESLGLSRPLVTALASINIKKPTEIQAACVEPILSGVPISYLYISEVCLTMA